MSGVLVPPGTSSQDFFSVHYFARHFLQLTWRQTPQGAPSRFVGISCSVAEIEGEWFLITAGHSVEEIRQRQAAGDRFDFWMLLDFHREQTSIDLPLPFDFDTVEKGAFYDQATGIDYAFIHVREGYRAPLAAIGVIPLTQESWTDHPSELSHARMVGVPYETIKPDDRGTSVTCGAYLMGLMGVPPSHASQEARNKPFPRFFFKIVSGMDEPAAPVTSIAGMSGCPVFGIREEGETWRYWWLGIETAWNPQTRIIEMCPIDARIEQVARPFVDQWRNVE